MLSYNGISPEPLIQFFFNLCPKLSPTFAQVSSPLYLSILLLFRIRRKKVVVSVNPPSTEDASSTDRRYASNILTGTGLTKRHAQPLFSRLSQ